jgi:glycosyltransferase involved in cell wall biosynthesis
VATRVSSRTSIIIPCHNYGRFLAEAVESALEQTLPPLEVIVVDDGSSDNSLIVARRYVERGVRVIEQANKGAIATFNTGIRASTGQYFVVLSADDRLDTRYLERTVPLLDANLSAGYVYTAYRLFGNDHRVLDAPPFSLQRLLLRPFIIATTLMRRSAFDESGGYSPAMEGGHEDWEFFITLAELGWFGLALPEVLFHYRKHSNSSRNAVSMTRWLDVHRRVYLRHRRLYHVPLRLYLAIVLLNQQWLRLRAAPRALARRFGPRARADGPARVVYLGSVQQFWPPPAAEDSPGAPLTIVVTPDRALRVDSAGAATPPPSHAFAGGTVSSFAGITVRALYQRAAIYHASNLIGLVAGTIAASANRAALLYEPAVTERADCESRLTCVVLGQLERLASIRCDMLLVGPRHRRSTPWPMPPMVVDAMDGDWAAPASLARPPWSVDRPRLNCLLHDLLTIP